MVLGILLIVIGILMVFKSGVIWRISESWKSYRAEEPSELYRLSTRVGGILMLLVGVGYIILMSIK